LTAIVIDCTAILLCLTHTDYSCLPDAYRGLSALVALSMADSVCQRLFKKV
jgi:hypothetical protein